MLENRTRRIMAIPTTTFWSAASSPFVRSPFEMILRMKQPIKSDIIGLIYFLKAMANMQAITGLKIDVTELNPVAYATDAE